MNEALDTMLSLSKHKGMKCWRGSMPEGELSEAIDQALVRQDITSAAISQYLRMQGTQVAPSAVARHRRGECGCGNG